MKLEVLYRGKTYRFDERMSALKLVRLMGLSWEEVLVLREGRILTEDEMVNPGDSIRVVAVVSGG